MRFGGKIKYLIIFSSIILFCTIGCKKSVPVEGNGNPCNDILPPIGVWQPLGLEGKLVPHLVLVNEYLYACAGRDGLYRRNLCRDAKWEYLGFADSTLFRQLDYGVTSLFYNNLNSEMVLGICTHRWEPEIGIFLSTNFGLTWIPSDSGIRTPRFIKSTEVSSLNGYPNANIIFSGMSATLYKSGNNGRTWKLVWGNPDAGGVGINSVKFDENDHRNIWAGGETGRFAPFALNSKDMGESWELIYPLPWLGPYGGDNAIYDIAVDPVNKGTVYLGMLGLIMKTTDDGKNWQKVLGWEDGIYRNWRIAMNPNNHNELLSTGAVLYRTTDAGQTWLKIIPPEGHWELYAMAVDWSNRVVYVSTSSYGGNGMFRSKF